MTVSMGMLIFAGLAYALEKDEPGTTFYTLPQTLYWAIITMTSTGRCLVIIMIFFYFSFYFPNYYDDDDAGDDDYHHHPDQHG